VTVLHANASSPFAKISAATAYTSSEKAGKKFAFDDRAWPRTLLGAKAARQHFYPRNIYHKRVLFIRFLINPLTVIYISSYRKTKQKQ